MNKIRISLIAAVFICLIATSNSQLTSSFLYPNSPFNFINPSSTDCCSAKTITVDGSATLQLKPDIAYLSTTLTVNGRNVSQAIQLLTIQVSRVIQVLNNNGINSTNYETSALNVYPNTSWSNGVSTVLGQIASESIKITIPTIDANGSNIGKLIDSLACINGIIVNGLSFDIFNKTLAFAQARDAAFQNAKKKAIDYTTALGVCIGQLVTVRDSYSVAPVVEQSGPVLSLAANSNSPSTPTTVNVGTIPVSYNL